MKKIEPTPELLASIKPLKKKHRGRKARLVKAKVSRLLKMPDERGPLRQHAHAITPQQRLARQEIVQRMRFEEGKTWDEIAAVTGTTPDTAKRDAKIIAKMKYEGMIEKDDMVLFEHNMKYEHMMSVWYPLLKPLMEGELKVGYTKLDREGREYDITLPTFEAAKTATEMLARVMLQKEKLNGYADPVKSGGLKPQEITETVAAVLTAFQNHVRPPTKKAEVIEGQLLEDKQ